MTLNRTWVAGIVWGALAGFTCAQEIELKNNYGHPIEGPFGFRSEQLAGKWGGEDSGLCAANGFANGFVSLDARGVQKVSASRGWKSVPAERLDIDRDGTLHICSENGQKAAISFLLGRWHYGQVTGENLENKSTPIRFQTLENADGSRLLTGGIDGWDINVTVRPYSGKTGRVWLDLDARVTRTKGAESETGFATLVRKVEWAGEAPRKKICWMSLELDRYEDAESQGMTKQYDTIQDIDWINLTSKGSGLQSFHLFNPSYSTKLNETRWASANSFLIRERMRENGSTFYMLSDLGSPGQETKGMMIRIPERLPDPGDEVKIRWVMAMGDAMDTQTVRRHFDGITALCTLSDDGKKLEFGVPHVELGTAYFPYSTETENFGTYRVKGHDRDGWWPFSPQLWSEWPRFKERIRADLRLIKSQGYGQVRLHWASHLNQMKWEDAFAYLDFMYEEAEKVGLKIMLDSKGTAEWQGELARRYGSRTEEFQVDNEEFLTGARLDKLQEFRAQYDAIKAASPRTKTYTATLMNIADTVKYKELGLPLDRVCLHAYAHFHAMKYDHAGVLGDLSRMMAMHGNELGLPTVCTEFNWKFLTHLTPDEQARNVKKMWEEVLATRSFPLIFQFQWQETFAANPAMSRHGYRHYEYMHQDRRPKKTLAAFQEATAPYLATDHVNCKIAGEFREAAADKDGTLSWNGWIENKTDGPLTVSMTMEGTEGLRFAETGAIEKTLAPKERIALNVTGSLPSDALPGHYFGFARIELDGDCRYIPAPASRVHNLKFTDEPFLSERVVYKDGRDSVKNIDFVKKPVVVVFGDKHTIMDLEMAILLRQTIQSATGKQVAMLADTDPLLKQYKGKALHIVVGTGDNQYVKALDPDTQPGKGSVEWVRKAPFGEALVFTAEKNGDRNPELHAAATDFVMRFWPAAKDSSMRIIGYENGTQLKNAAATGALNSF
jgi:hypothetical protein